MPPRQFHLKNAGFRPKVELSFSDSYSDSSYSNSSNKNQNFHSITKTNTYNIPNTDEEESNEDDCFHLNSKSEIQTFQSDGILEDTANMENLNKNKQTENSNRSLEPNEYQTNQNKNEVKTHNETEAQQDIHSRNTSDHTSNAQENINNFVSPTNNDSQFQQQQEPEDNDKQEYKIMYKQKNFQANSKRCLQMTQRGILLYTCEPSKSKKYGKIHIICTQDPVNIDSPHFIGLIVRHQKGQRFTLYGKCNESENQRPQLAGISFIKIKGDIVIRHFRIALPKEGTVYYSDKEDDLSQIAFKGKEVENIKIYSSSLPIIHPDGSLTQNFGPYSIISSRNNFIIRDEETNSSLFTSFKTYNGICTLILRPPFTPLIGIALAVAILTS